MKTIRIGAASVNQTPVDWIGNRQRLVTVVDEARAAGVRLLCLPELCVSGYGCDDLFFAPHVRERALFELDALSPATRGIAVCVGLPLEVRGRLYVASAMVVDGRLRGFALKQRLADDGLHYEPRWFDRWPTGELGEVAIDGRTYPVGMPVFDFQGVRVGFEICRDAWVEDRLAPRLAERGVGVILNPSASHFAFGKQAIRKRLARAGAATVGGVFVYCNLLGNEAGQSIFDGGTLFASAVDGAPKLIAEGERFSYADHTLTCIDVEAPETASVDHPGIAVDFDLAAKGGAPASTPTPAWENGARLKHEELARAVPLGLHDYLRKSGARGFVLSLSGGADSAATAVFVWLMARLAVAQGGVASLASRLPTVPGLGDAADAEGAVRRVLLTLYQATRNSSDTTRQAARAVAEAVGAEHHEWSVEDLVERYVGLAEGVVGRELTWDADDLVLQNIQARVRSPGVWMLANLRRALLLTTGNRSEASVGYATMDGDTSGGLAPIAGVDKAFLLEWLRWMETDGPENVGPLPALAAIIDQRPTAELRPPSESQADEADLMPYAVLDAIERSAIGRLEPRDTTIERLVAAFPSHVEEQLAEWVDRFHRLWSASQWKRERLAPSFHLDTIGVDPRTWRRWPILSGDGAWASRERQRTE